MLFAITGKLHRRGQERGEQEREGRDQREACADGARGQQDRRRSEHGVLPPEGSERTSLAVVRSGVAHRGRIDMLGGADVLRRNRGAAIARPARRSRGVAGPRRAMPGR